MCKKANNIKSDFQTIISGMLQSYEVDSVLSSIFLTFTLFILFVFTFSSVKCLFIISFMIIPCQVFKSFLVNNLVKI